MPIRFHGHRREQSLQQITEEDEVAAEDRLRGLGLLPERRHQLSPRRRIDSSNVAFVHPPVDRPPVHHPIPR